MARRMTTGGRPADYDDFPTVGADAPVVVRRAAGLVARLQVVVDEHGVRETGRRAGVSHSTLSRTLAGEVWPSFATIVLVEEAFGVDLWGAPDLES